MKLSPNFSLEELTHTSTGLPNDPSPAEKTKLLYLANYLLQPIRDRWGALTITSGFRCWLVNSVLGGALTSQHLFGEAADFIPYMAKLDEVYDWIVNHSGLVFGQAIKEDKGGKRWIHLSLVGTDNPPGQALVYDGKNYKPYAR